MVCMVVLWWLQPEATVNDFEILSETSGYVEVRHARGTGRFYKEFLFGFDGEFETWFGEGKWTTMALLSPSAKTVQDYHALRTKIFAGEADFADNRIEAMDGAAKFSAVAPTEDMVTSKSMLENNQLWFVNGDDLWFRAKYHLESGTPYTLVDFQERGRTGSPGPRVTIDDGKFLGIELKHGLKPRLRQDQVRVPLGEWFELKVHLRLDHQSGHAHLWQDGILLIDGPIQTLPEKDSLLNALEVGITATSEAAVLLMDDVVISHGEL